MSIMARTPRLPPTGVGPIERIAQLARERNVCVVAWPNRDHMTMEARATQGKVADQIQHLVSHNFIVEPKRA